MNPFSTFTRTPRRPMRKVSEKRLEENRVYLELRAKFLTRHPMCQFKNCCKRSFDVHHKAGRLGTNFLNVKTWMAICRGHHDWIEFNKNEARKLGLITYR